MQDETVIVKDPKVISTYAYEPNDKVHNTTLIDLHGACIAALDELNPNFEFGKTILSCEPVQKLRSILEKIAFGFNSFYPYDKRSHHEHVDLYNNIFHKEYKIKNRFPGSELSLKDASLTTLITGLCFHLRVNQQRIERKFNNFVSETISEMDNWIWSIIDILGDKLEKIITIRPRPTKEDKDNRDIRETQNDQYILDETKEMKKTIYVEPLAEDLKTAFAHASLKNKAERSIKLQNRPPPTQEQSQPRPQRRLREKRIPKSTDNNEWNTVEKKK